MTGPDGDPYVVWAKKPGTIPFLSHLWAPVLLALRDCSIAKFAQGGMFAQGQDQDEFRASVQVPDEYTHDSDANDDDEPFCMAMVRFDYFVSAVKKSPLADVIAAYEFGLSLEGDAFNP